MVKNEGNKWWESKRFRLFIGIIGISALIIIPIGITLFLVDYFVVDISQVTELFSSYSRKLTITANDFPTLSEIIYYLICIYTLIITGIFSWVIWQTSKKSNQLAEEIKIKEENRDKENVRENALIIYYDLTLAFEDLRKLFISRIINKEKSTPSRIFLSNDWIKNVAILRDKLKPEETNDIYLSKFHIF